MLNSNLPHGELTKSLDEYIDRIDYVLKELGSKISGSIIDDKQLMGKIHHAINIHNYGKPIFMENLLKRARKKQLELFLHRTHIIKDSLDVNESKQLIQRAARLPWGNNENTKAFVDVFGYEESLIPQDSEDIQASEICLSSGVPLKTLKEYQAGIFYKGMEQMCIPWSRFIVKMPTGAGKTRTSMEIICHFFTRT